MINIDYSNGQIKITTEDLRNSFSEDQLPLKFEIKKVISKEIVWTTHLHNFMWASYPENEINDVIVTDAKGNFVYRYYWDLLTHGSIFYKSLWFYCKSLINQGKTPNGLVIGTHDGEFGEWVPVIRNYMSSALLVEGSVKQFNKLEYNYKNKNNVTCMKNIITPDGADVEFFEGGRGYTNSVVERVIRSWEKEEITSSFQKSLALNELIRKNFSSEKKLDWLHLDVEGLDVKLLLSLEKEFIPNLIIFEDYNLSQEDRDAIHNWIIQNNFKSISTAGICMLNKNF